MKDEIDIEELIPHRAPVLCIDRFVDLGEGRGMTIFTPNSDFVFQRNGCISTAGLIENIAQSVAARAGYICRQQGKEIPKGHIASIKYMYINNLPQLSTELNTHITFVQEVFNLSIFSATVKQGNEEVATCEIHVLIEDT